jgi:hypothetical protein
VELAKVELLNEVSKNGGKTPMKWQVFVNLPISFMGNLCR